jgi:hypothetical protein
MAKQTVNVGTSASDGTGDDLRVAFTKVNENFTELYSGNVQVTAANILVYSVAGRTGNVVLTVNDVAQAASKSYVNTAIASNLANVTGSITNSINANVTAANAVISNHAARITTLESNAATQATAIASLQNTRATTSYVDTSINLALSSNAVLANVASVNANVAAANLAIAGKASLTGAIFSGNAQASWVIANTGVRVGNTIIVGSSSESTTFPATPNLGAFFAGDTRIGGSLNKYFQIRAQNLDPNGSTDLVLAADDVTSTNNYVSFGVAGSTYNDITYPDIQPHDAYLISGNSNLVINSITQRVQILTNFVKRFEVDQTGMVRLLDGARLEFPDGTIQSTAFGGNTNVTAINANITAANVAIAALQSNAASQALDINSLYANAGAQATSINVLIANAASQAQSLTTLTGNISTLFANAVTQDSSIITLISNAVSQNSSLVTLTANAVSQSLDLDNLFANAATQQTTINTLVANAATQAASLTTLTANAAAQTDLITTLTANAATQAASLTTLTANAATQAASLTTLTANAASQALDINNLYSNLTIYISNVQTINSNVAAANTRIQLLDANLGTATTNITTLFSNAASQAVSINSINANIAAANVDVTTKANISGQIFSGNIQAPYVISDSNVKVGGTLEVGGATTFARANVGGVFAGNVNNQYQVILQNTSTGTSAGTRIVIAADDGDTTDNYMFLGLNNSGFASNIVFPGGDTGLPRYAHDGGINVVGGNAVISTDNFIFFVANANVAGLLSDGTFFAPKLSLTGGATFADLTLSEGGLASGSGTAIELSGNDVNVVGNIQINSNHIKSSTDSVAIKLDDGNVITNNHLTVTGNIYSNQILSSSNISFKSNIYEVRLTTDGNLTLTTANLKFYDGTVQRTAIVDVPGLFANIGNITNNISRVNANVFAANIAISSLVSNAAIQAAVLDTLTGNAATQSQVLDTLTSNAATQSDSLTVLIANAATQSDSLTVLLANAASQGTFLNNLNSNLGTATNNITTIQANVGAYQTYANANIVAIQTGISAYQTYANANSGAYQTFANANAAAQATAINTINANIAAANAAIIILTTNAAAQATAINTINANIAAANTAITALTGNAATQATSINTVNANLGAYQTFANANAAAQAISINTVNANIGAYQTYANANIAAIQANIGSFYTYSNANIAAIQANIGSFYTYANTKIGTNTNSNLVVLATTTSTSTTTGALVVGGGAGVAGNLYVGDNTITAGGKINPGYFYANVVTDQNLFANVIYNRFIANASPHGTVANLWITLPSTAVDGQELDIVTTVPITSCFVNQAGTIVYWLANTWATTGNVSAKLQYIAAAGKWTKVG